MTQSTEVNISLDVDEVFAALETWIKQRPGLDPRDYIDTWRPTPEQRRAYMDDMRQCSKDRKRALSALDEARNLQPQKPELLADAFRAYSGRLQWVPASEPWGTHHCNKPLCAASQPHHCPCKCDICKPEHRAAHLRYTTGQYWPTEYRKAAASVLETYIASWRQWYASQHPVTFEYRTIDDVIAANRQIGHHYFDRSTMSFFKCKIESGAVAIHDEAGRPTRARFITSEKGPSEVRRYSIREAQPDGTIDTIGEFQQYRTRDAARAALLK